MRAHRGFWMLSLGLLVSSVHTAAFAADPNQIIRLLESRSCQGCRLQDADLVQADLRDAHLRNTSLQRANLSGARLDSADLRGANLSFTSLVGASLRGADLRGADLNGTDLRQADLSGAQLDPGALSRTHWQQTQGITAHQLTYAELHNAGVAASQAGRQPEAERWFNEALQRDPDAAISWVARGISRNAQGNTTRAAADFTYAAQLYRLRGEEAQAKVLEDAAKQITAPSKMARGGNGSGGQILGGAIAALRMLAPLAQMASKAFVPMGF